MNISPKPDKKIQEIEYICPSCKGFGEVVNIGNVKYLKCDKCIAHYKLSDLVCPACLQQKDTFTAKDTDEIYTVCWNCASLNEIRLCLHFASGNKSCRKCGGIGLLIDTSLDEDNPRFDVCHSYNDCLGAFLSPELYQFTENGKTLGKERILEILKTAYRTKVWPDALNVRINRLVKKSKS